MSWATDAHGLGRRSHYVDRAPKPPQLRKCFRGYTAETHRFEGELCLVITAKDQEFIDCGTSESYGVQEQVSAVLSFGVQIGVARSWSRERSFKAHDCGSCVPVLTLTNATLVQEGRYTRGKVLKASSTVRTLMTKSDCERHWEIDCIPKRCPGCLDADLTGWDEAPRVVDTEPAPQSTVVTVAVQSCSVDTATEDELAEVASAWVGDLLAQPVSDFGGVFVHSPWNSLVFLPRHLSEEPPASLPAVLLSAGLEWEPLGAAVAERGARVPVIVALPSAGSLDATASIMPEGAPDQVVTTAPVRVDKMGSLSVATAMVSTGGIAGRRADIFLEFSDKEEDRSGRVRLPVLLAED